MNNGEVKANTAFGDSSTGFSGLIGAIFADGIKMTFKIDSCQNNGNVVAKGPASGFFCVPPSSTGYDSGITVTLNNCVNKGNVTSSSDKAYGISNVNLTRKETTAKSVVSMGTVKGKSGSYLFWSTRGDTSFLFGLQNVCQNCDNSVVQFKEEGGMFFTVSDHKRVDQLLNEKVLSEGYGLGWSKSLDVKYPIPSKAVTIKTPDYFEFFRFLMERGVYQSQAIDVSLETDLDFSNENDLKPLGLYGSSCNEYSGTFNGNGHSINNLDMKSKSASLFCGLNNAVIKNIIIESTCRFLGDDKAYSIGVCTKGKIVVENVKNKASVEAENATAGLLFVGQECTPVVRNCVNEGDVESRDQIAAGLLVAANSKAVIFNSINKGDVFAVVSYGIASYAATTYNVVSLGRVIAPSDSDYYATWEGAIGAFSSQFCLNSVKSKLPDDCIVVKKKGSEYYIAKNDTLLVDILNSNAPEDKFNFHWTDDLDLESSN